MDKKLQKPYYKLQIIDSRRFVVSLLSNLVENISGKIHNIKFKHGPDNKKYEL